jgi:hypothetical protein
VSHFHSEWRILADYTGTPATSLSAFPRDWDFSTGGGTIRGNFAFLMFTGLGGALLLSGRRARLTRHFVSHSLRR